MVSSTAISSLQKMQNKCIALIKTQHATINLYKQLCILRIKEMLELENCKFGFKLLQKDLPIHIMELATTDQFGNSLKKQHNYNTRNRNLLNKPLSKNKHYRNCIIYKGTGALEILPNQLKMKPNLQLFSKSCKSYLLHKM